ncbi:alpha/beta hydrolase family protein [Streptomyces pactum]|uniref:alpha/beta hydrolase family protein n=1 Tax=Streptomyces pactum TaxID=68249 RepID=UPI0037006D69
MNRRLRVAAQSLVCAALSLTALTAGTAAAAPPPSAASADPAPGTRSERPRLPATTGPYAVGRDTLHLVDGSRTDPWVLEAGARELMVTVYYPARRGTGGPARYATTEEARLLLRNLGLEGVVRPETVSGTVTRSRTGARPLPGSHPLVLLSPGLSAGRYSLTSLAEDLASRGYLVAAVDHAYESFGTSFPGGRVLTCVACEQAETGEDLRRATEGRARDLTFVLDQLTGGRPDLPYARLIDRARIGVAGHSLGGATSIPAMAADGRFRAGLNMDGAFHAPVPPGGLGGRPVLMLGTDDEVHRPGGRDATWDATWRGLDGWKRWLTVAGADHNSFTDHPVLAPYLATPAARAGTAPAGEQLVATTRGVVAAHFDRHLNGIPQAVLDGPVPDQPLVRYHRP